MSSESTISRRLRLSAPFGVFLCFLLTCATVSANKLPEDAPVLISEAKSTRALTVRPARRGLDASAQVFQPGGKTKITLFVTNLDLLPGEGATAFRADIQDERFYRFPLEVVSLEPTIERPWVYAITVRLHGGIGDVGDVLVRVAWRGMSSNRVRLSIGHEGGNIRDDEGALPTPMPDRPFDPAEAQRGDLPWTGDRVRFMEQTTFGPKPDIELRIRRLGLSVWLNEQLEERTERFSTFPYPNLQPQPQTPLPTCDGNPAVPDVPATCFRDNYSMYPLQNWFFREALYGEDQQLRRRVSWSLSQIFVVSGRETIQPSRMIPYLQTLDRHAFGNYRDLLRNITLNPAMGNYLDMAISTKQNPNENYAREILQLFSIGIDMLKPDGTPLLDGQGNRIPTYDQAIVNGFTKVFTGWNFCNVQAICPSLQPGIVNYRDPMIVTAANHDNGAKQVLNYSGAVSQIPANQTAEQDFEDALNNVFYHPNVPPFVSKLLIQQLVTSNPTPAYVSRVSSVFVNNGQGTRGDLKAVIRAILLDPEARGNNKTDPDFGKLREPVLFVTNVLRPFNPAANNNLTPAANCNGLSDGVINGVTLPLDQDVFYPPTVFNYYPMDYFIPNTNLAGPEFGIFSTGTALKRPNFVNQMVFPTLVNGQARFGILITTANNPTTNIPCGTTISLARLQSIAQADSTGTELVDTLNREMTHGAMSAAMRNEILTAVQAVASSNPLKRAQTAVYLVATAPQFQVQR